MIKTHTLLPLIKVFMNSEKQTTAPVHWTDIITVDDGAVENILQRKTTKEYFQVSFPSTSKKIVFNAYCIVVSPVAYPVCSQHFCSHIKVQCQIS